MLPADTSIGPYQIVSPLGAGGMGEVYRARDRRLERDVALKLLPRDAAHDQMAIGRFFREARAASSLNHPNIVTIHEIGDTDTYRYIVMELVQGRTLRQLIAERPPIDLVIRLAAQIAQALAVAHAAGIVHRDIKPENIMVRPDGYVKVVDFGLAYVFPLSHPPEGDTTMWATTKGMLLGTVRYMSPEQAHGDQAGSASDMFSLGLVIYELSTGQHPFQADSNFGVLAGIATHPALPPSRLNPEISSAHDALIMQLLEKDARLRPSAADVARALLDLTDKEPLVGAALPARVRTKRSVVGRVRERAELDAAFKSVRTGRGMVISVAGELGIGKTTLVEWFLEDLAESGGSYVARGRCSERLSRAEAYLPLLECLDALIHAPSGDHLARVMKMVAPTWYGQIAPLATQDSSGNRAAIASRDISPERLKRELTQFIEEVSRARPVVLVVDDVHWMDVSSTDILAYLADRLDTMRVLVIVSYRPTELLGGRHPFVQIKLELEARGVGREIQLSGLERDGVDRYLTAAFPRHRFPAAFVDLIHSKTEGSPLFLSELLRYLRDKKVVVEDQDVWYLAGSLPDVVSELPESLRSMIQRQIDRLDDVERRLLLGAAVQGQEFHAAVVAKAASADAADVEDRLDRLDRIHGLVRRVREEELPDHTLTLRYRFVHVLYQNALYLSLTPARKASLAGAVAHALIGFYGEQSPAAELAILFEAARDFSSAADYFKRAARNAAAVAAHHEAVLLARRGLKLLRSLPETAERDQRELALLITLGVPLTASQSYASPEVGEAYARARELAQQSASPQVFPVLHGLYRFYFVRGELASALELSEQLLERAERAGEPGMLMEAHRAMGNTLFYRGEIVRGRAHLETAMGLYDPKRHHVHTALYGIDPSAASSTVAALALWNEGYPDRARALTHEAVARARELKHPFTLAWTLTYMSLLYLNCGDAAAARAAADEVQRFATEHSFPFWLAASAIVRARAEFEEGGDPGRALQDMHGGLQAWFATGARITAPYFLTLIADTAISAGRFSEARAAMVEATTNADHNLERWWLAEEYRVQAVLLVKESASRGDAMPPDAEANVERALTIARQQGSKSIELRAAMTLAKMRAVQGRADEGLQLVRMALASFTEGFDTADLKAAVALLAEQKVS